MMADADTIDDIPGIVALIGGKRNALKASVVITLLVAGTTFLTMMGVRQTWPNERMTAYEIGLAHANIRIDSTNLTFSIYKDSVSRDVAVRRANRDVMDRVELAMACDHFPPVQQRLLTIREKCVKLWGTP